MSQDSSVGIVTDYGLDDWMIRVQFLAGLGIFLFSTMSRPALRPTHPPIQWVLGILSLEVKQPGDVKLTTHLHIVQRSKNAWSYTSTPPIYLHGMVLI
jgi:hypothetical protein